VQAYIDADVFVLPSRYEMWGLTWMEALACGTPVVMTEKCEASKVLPSFCGMVAQHTPESLAVTIKRVIKMNSVFPQYKPSRQEWVKQYSWDNIIPKILKVYEEAITCQK
jgi:glycosyltransferase involved in cell wall biosynthesis